MAWYVYMLRCGDGSLYTGLHHRRGPSAPGAPERDRGQIHSRPASGVAGLHRGGSGPLHRPAPGGGYQKAAPETEIGADRRRYTMNLKKRLVLGENGSSAGKLLGRITGIGPGRYNRCGGSVQALCHEAGRMTVL